MHTALSGSYGVVGQGEAGKTMPSPRLVRAAHEFEGQMMKELLQPLTSDDPLTGASDASDSGIGSGGTLSEFASESLGQALSRRGGFGIADRVIQSLSRDGNHRKDPSVT